MMNSIAVGLFCFLGGILGQYLGITLQRRWRVIQVQKSYGIGIDLDVKGSTPTMGGVVFFFLALTVCLYNFTEDSFFLWSLPLGCAFIGFIDDGLKFSRKSSEGFSSLSKLTAQLILGSIWVYWAILRNDLAFWPGLSAPVWVTAPFAILAVVGTMNAVNVTDGLDGLAAGSFLISLGILFALLPKEPLNLSVWAALFGIAASFLLFNAHPALVFMGDTGSHFLGGALVALCIRNQMMLALIPAGVLFGIEILSSALQIVAIRKFNKKIFKMAPLHHHFQRMGWKEATVTVRFWVVHAVAGLILAALCLELWGRGV